MDYKLKLALKILSGMTIVTESDLHSLGLTVFNETGRITYLWDDLKERCIQTVLEFFESLSDRVEELENENRRREDYEREQRESK